MSAMDADFAPGLPAMEAIAASELAPEADQETHGVPKGPGKISKGAYFPGPLGEPKGSPMSPLPPISPPFEIRGFQLRWFFGRVFFCSMVSI